MRILTGSVYLGEDLDFYYGSLEDKMNQKSNNFSPDSKAKAKDCSK